MGALLNRVSDEMARLDSEEVALDAAYVARKTAITARRQLLKVALTRITDDLEQLVDKLGIEVR